MFKIQMWNMNNILYIYMYMGAHLTLPAYGKATSRGENLWLNIYDWLLAYTAILNQSMFGEHMAWPASR
jgi:hypothetical protein